MRKVLPDAGVDRERDANRKLGGSDRTSLPADATGTPEGRYKPETRVATSGPSSPPVYPAKLNAQGAACTKFRLLFAPSSTFFSSS